MPELEDTAEIRSTGIFGNAYDDHDLETLNTPYADQSVGAEADFNNIKPSTIVSHIPTTRVHFTYPKAQIIGDLKSAVQTRGMTKKNSEEHAMISYIQKQRRTNLKDFQNCLFFKIQKVWTLVDLPSGKKVIGTKWVYRNKKDERGIVVRNKARLVAQGYKQEEGIEKDSADTEILLQEEEPTELVEDQGSGEKGEKEVSTVGAEHSTVIPKVSTAAANLTKKQLEQKRLGHEEAIRLQEQIDKDERLRIARDAKIAKQLQEDINKATQEQEKQEVVTKADPTHVINWSDPAVLRYHALQNMPYSVAKVRKNMCIYLKNQGGFKMSHFKGMSYEEIRPIFEKV
ncbi:putative ribonuclease H-like domain-containing protein [Tanacetum coccineum]